MFVRRRPLLRAAAVGGTAYMVGKSRAQHQAETEQAQAGQAQPGHAQPGQAGASGQQTPSQPAPGSETEPAMTDQLSRLASLHQQGALTDAEFAAAKTRLLGT